MKRIAILVSGSGTNMQNLVEKMQAGEIAAEPVIVISDKQDAGAIQRAANLHIKSAVVERKKFETKEQFEAEIIRHLELRNIDLICLAGFMRILSDAFVKKYYGRLINIHPSYLPDFPGAHAIRDAFGAKVRETGVTVHFVSAEVDAGPIILQRMIQVEEGETLESLEAKVHALEYEIYPEALRLVLAGEAKVAESP